MTKQEEQKLIAEVARLTAELKKLASSTTIPRDVGEAFKVRITSDIVADSSKTIASASKAVNEAGAASYNVALPPSGFIRIKVRGGYKNVPYYT